MGYRCFTTPTLTAISSRRQLAAKAVPKWDSSKRPGSIHLAPEIFPDHLQVRCYGCLDQWAHSTSAPPPTGGLQDHHPGYDGIH
jgi:hypothetical protein